MTDKPKRPRKPKEKGDSWEKKFELASSLLGFRRRAMDTLDDILMRLFKDGSDYAAQTFETPGGRPVLLLFAVGEDAVAELMKQAKALETQANG